MLKGENKNRDSEILQRLEELKQEDKYPPRFIELYRCLFDLQTGVRSSLAISGPPLSEETALIRLKQGISLLGFDDISLDWTLVQNQFSRVIDTLTEHLEVEEKAALGLRTLASNIPLLQQVVRDWYQGSSLSSIAAGYGVSADLLVAAIQATLRPFLMAHSEASGGLMRQDMWRRRVCPFCGGKPDFAFLDKDSGGRCLFCSRCDAQWLFQRLECPYCGAQDKGDLSYLTDDHEIYRLYTCEKCHSYIKAIDLRKTGSEVLLALERIITVDMDRQANAAGYEPG